MKVAIEGCCHGCLDHIYRAVAKKNIDLLIICGDVQTIRNKVDLQCMNVPDKYKSMGSFQDYYSGRKKAPIFTIFIGGNHEASNYLEELKYGGFVAPNIYYMGRTSVIWYKGLRIGGISGIYYKSDFMQLAPNEYPIPFNHSNIRSIYHYRKDDYFKLKLLDTSNKMIFTSHDWPEGIYNYGSVNKLLKMKPFFTNDVKTHSLGSPFNMELLKSIKPNYWFSAHLHVRFVANIDWNKKRVNSVSHEKVSKKVHTENQNSADEIVLEMDMSDEENIVEKHENKEVCDNHDEIKLDIDDENSVSSQKSEEEKSEDAKKEDINSSMIKENLDLETPISTKFLSLDKCLPKRNYLEYLDLELTDKNHISNKHKNSPLYYDEEYISSLKVIEKYKLKLNDLGYKDLLEPPENLISELKILKDYQLKEYQSLNREEYNKLFKIPLHSFVKTAPINQTEFKVYKNKQTETFMGKFLI